MDKSKIRRILVITLSNIGDAILTTPVIQVLKGEIPQAHLAILVGPRAFSVFRHDERIDTKIIYDKTISWRNKLALINRLRKDRYDLVVDLRHSLLGLVLDARYHTSIFAQPPKSMLHMRDRHLWRVHSLGFNVSAVQRPQVFFSADEQDNVQRLLIKWQLKPGQGLVVVAPGARNSTKRWEGISYAKLIKQLMMAYNLKVIIAGDQQDQPLAKKIVAQTKLKIDNLCGQTSIGELACLLTKAQLLITNDSSPMHLGWAAGIPVVSIFGPTDYRKYAPNDTTSIAIRQDLPCAPCEKSLCFKGSRECMKLITVEQVFAACKKVLDVPVDGSQKL